MKYDLIDKIFKIFCTGISDNDEVKKYDRLRYNIAAFLHLVFISALISSIMIGILAMNNNGFYKLGYKGAVALLSVATILLIPELFIQMCKFVHYGHEAYIRVDNDNNDLSCVQTLQLFVDPLGITE